jgi:uncharacterized protein YbjT (DUF2867 family)
VLHAAFDYPHARVAEVLETSEANARQLFSRAKKHLDAARPRPVPAAERARLLGAFLAAAGDGDLDALEAVLASDVVSISDGGGRVPGARVGVDRIPYGYYVDKVASERAITASGIPSTILRATQFHAFPGEILAMLGGHPFVRGVSIQPIEVEDVAVRLAELATTEPAGRVAHIGGPEILTAEDILSRLQRAGRTSTRVLSLALPGKTFAAYRAGHHLTGLPGYGTQTFDAWLASGATK